MKLLKFLLLQFWENKNSINICLSYKVLYHKEVLPCLESITTNAVFFGLTAYKLWTVVTIHLFNVLCDTAVPHQIFIRSQILIARWMHNNLSLPAVAHDFMKLAAAMTWVEGQNLQVLLCPTKICMSTVILWIKGWANFELTTPVRENHVSLRRIQMYVTPMWKPFHRFLI